MSNNPNDRKNCIPTDEEFARVRRLDKEWRRGIGVVRRSIGRSNREDLKILLKLDSDENVLNNEVYKGGYFLRLR